MPEGPEVKIVADFLNKKLENKIITELNYCSKPYNFRSEYGISLGSLPIKMPKIKFLISDKDKKLPTFKEFLKE